MKIEAFRFSDDGDVPNHPHWPMIVYRGALSGSERDCSKVVSDGWFEAHADAARRHMCASAWQLSFRHKSAS